jgi:hypothetical protein
MAKEESDVLIRGREESVGHEYSPNESSHAAIGLRRPRASLIGAGK